jgi:hypothetical protein
MFGSKIPVLFISRKTIKSAVVSGGKHPEVKSLKEAPFQEETLVTYLTDLKKQLGSRNWRVIFADDVSYLLTLEIPAGISNKREYIGKKAAEKIPEILDTHDWDFREYPDGKKVLVFAPVREVWHIVNLAFEKAGIEAAVTEPEKLARLRHSDPMIGIALKKDIKGKDEKVLNLRPEKISTEQAGEAGKTKETKEYKKPAVNKRLLIIFIAVMLFSSLSIGGIFYYRFQSQSVVRPESSLAIPVQSPTSSPENTPVPTKSPEIDLSAYSIQILNGSGVAGEAGAVEEILIAEGFENITTGDADSYDYTDTQVQMKKDTSEKVFEAIERALNSDYPIVRPDETLTENADYDTVIILGEKI